jgi:preprotein translocase subunit SecE
MLGVRIPPGLPFIFTGRVRMDKIKAVIFQVKQFLREVKSELKKVTWPTTKAAMASTSVVIVVVIIVSLFLGLVDMGLTRLIRLILG